MQASNRLGTAFSEGKQSFGAWQMLPGANISRLLARSGVDWVLVDCEHGNIDGKPYRGGDVWLMCAWARDLHRV